MATKISYDPNTISSLVTACANAKNDLDSAANVLNLVQSHADWTCKEKDEIDDMVRAMKKLIQATQANQDSFFNAIRRVAGLYTGKENSIKSWFSSVDGLIGKIMSIKATVAATIGAHIGVSSGLNISSIVSSAKEQVSNIASGMRKCIDILHTGIYKPHIVNISPSIISNSSGISIPNGISAAHTVFPDIQIGQGISAAHTVFPDIQIGQGISAAHTGIPIPHLPNPIASGSIVSHVDELTEIASSVLPPISHNHTHGESIDGIPICRFIDMASQLKG